MDNDTKTAPGLFLESVQIHAFRGLREIGLSDLARVNLLVGKNDSGKTSILEALALFTTRLDIWEWAAIGRTRQVKTSARAMDSLSDIDAIRWMFPHDSNQESEDETHRPITMTGTGRVVQRHFSASCIRIRGIPPGADRARSFFVENEPTAQSEIFAEGENLTEDEGWLISVDYTDQQNSASPARGNLIRFSLWESLGLRQFPSRRPPGPDTMLLPPYAHRDQTLSLRLLTHTIMADQKKEISDLLSRLDPDIRGIEIITISNGNRPAIAIRHAQSGLVPLSVLGDGVRRALSIALAIRKAKDGLLLIDEIESALHVSALSVLFPWMVEACQTHNVQLIATTHSLEAIDVIATLAVDGPARDIAAYHLTGPSDTPAPPRRYTGGMLRRLVHEQGLDVR